MTEKIIEALKQLDVADESQWTKGGDPAVEAVSELAGETVTRQQIIDAAPKFNKENPVIDEDETGNSEENSTEDTGATLNLSPPEIPYEEVNDPTIFVNTYLKDKSQDDLAETVRTIQSDEEILSAEIREKEKLIQKIRQVKSVAREYYVSRFPETTFEESQKDFINKTQARKKANVGIANEFIGNIAKSIGGSQIDNVMSNKTGHGTKRPTFLS